MPGPVLRDVDRVDELGREHISFSVFVIINRISLWRWRYFWPLLLLLGSIEHVRYHQIPHHAECGHVFVWKLNASENRTTSQKF